VVKKSTFFLDAIMALRKVLAENVKRLRRERSLSQEALADAIGIDRTYVSALERERYSASIDMLERLAKGLGVEAPELISAIASKAS
jgi:transcriptional regulator with XRE-family HTH domain